MITTMQSNFGKVLATMILALMMVVVARPDTAHAFGPFSAIGAVANVIMGSQVADAGPAMAERKTKSLAEAALGLTEDGDASSLVSMAKRGSLIRADLAPRN